MLACLLGKSGEIIFPKMDYEVDMMSRKLQDLHQTIEAYQQSIEEMESTFDKRYQDRKEKIKLL